MSRFALLAMFFIVPLAAQAADTFKEGEHYERITPEVATQADGKIEVVEVFWYGCHHCYSFEPDIKKWLKSKPDNVKFRRVPGVFARNCSKPSMTKAEGSATRTRSRGSSPSTVSPKRIFAKPTTPSPSTRKPARRLSRRKNMASAGCRQSSSTGATARPPASPERTKIC